METDRSLITSTDVASFLYRADGRFHVHSFIICLEYSLFGWRNLRDLTDCLCEGAHKLLGLEQISKGHT